MTFLFKVYLSHELQSRLEELIGIESPSQGCHSCGILRVQVLFDVVAQLLFQLLKIKRPVLYVLDHTFKDF